MKIEKDKQGNLQFKPVAKEAISTLRPAYEKSLPCKGRRYRRRMINKSGKMLI